MHEMDLVIDEVDTIRKGISRSTDLRSPHFLEELARRLNKSQALSRQPIVQSFVSDIRNYQDVPRLAATKAHVNSARDNHIFSLFDVTYFPSLSLDYLTYEELATHPQLAARYPSPTRPVNITASSTGFRSRIVVALFPENHLDGIQHGTDLIFYFINKFVERHNLITRKMIEAAMAPGSLPLIRGASDSTITSASSWWVHLHEYHHRQGDMPIPEFLPAKRAKPLAGLEELRVDVSSMLACLHDDRLAADEAGAAYEYILAERLLRYAVEGIPRPNYDAVASQLLFNYLNQHGGIRLRDDIIHLSPDLPDVLAEFLGEIESIEARIRAEPVDEVRARLLAFTHTYTKFDEEVRDYQHIPYFAALKRRMGV